eukprot:2891014-Pyramimonas_sp.AAC.1
MVFPPRSVLARPRAAWSSTAPQTCGRSTSRTQTTKSWAAPCARASSRPAPQGSRNPSGASCRGVRCSLTCWASRKS